MSSTDPRDGEPGEGPVVNDRRRLDPETGELRQSSAGAGPAGQAVPGGSAADGAQGSELAAAQAEAADRLEALMRLKAEYENYRKRVDRDRDLVRENAVAGLLRDMLGVLDDIGRAREHGDLTGGFRSVGDALEAVTQKFGLVRYGDVGDEFDPMIHEALMHSYSDEVSAPTCTQVLMPGYRHGERVLRAARVAVADPTASLPEPDPAQAIGNDVPDNSTSTDGGSVEQDLKGSGPANPGGPQQ